jgi:hypothetical protein
MRSVSWRSRRHQSRQSPSHALPLYYCAPSDLSHVSIASPRSHHQSTTTTSLLWSQQLPMSVLPTYLLLPLTTTSLTSQAVTTGQCACLNPLGRVRSSRNGSVCVYVPLWLCAEHHTPSVPKYLSLEIRVFLTDTLSGRLTKRDGKAGWVVTAQLYLLRDPRS